MPAKKRTLIILSARGNVKMRRGRMAMANYKWANRMMTRIFGLLRTPESVRSSVKGEPDDDTNFGSHANTILVRISVTRNS